MACVVFGHSAPGGGDLMPSPRPAAEPPVRKAASKPATGDGCGTEKRVGGLGEGTRPPECGRHSQEDAALAFDPAALDREGGPSNSPSRKTTTGGEDWLTVNFYVNHGDFESLSHRLDEAQAAAAAGIEGQDELQVGDVRFLVAPRGARQGSGPKAVQMRWRMQSEHGLTLLLLNRAEAHDTLANVQGQAGSVLLMRYGFDRTWQLMQYCVEHLGAEIVADKLSRVDACADLAGMPVADLNRPFSQGWVVSRTRARAEYAVGRFMNNYLAGKEATGFSVGKTPLMLRVYDKLCESARQPEKLAVLQSHRWGTLPSCATRVEFQLHRGKLKDFGVDSVGDWIDKRADILDLLSRDWFRLTAGPVDRNHADRSEMHSAWLDVREAFMAWTGERCGVSLSPLPKVWINTSRQMAMVVGILKGNFARVGKRIEDNEQFYREAMFAIRQAVGERDMSAEIRRRALELGAAAVTQE